MLWVIEFNSLGREQKKADRTLESKVLFLAERPATAVIVTVYRDEQNLGLSITTVI